MQDDRRDFMRNTALASTTLLAAPLAGESKESTPLRMRDVGWVWEGQGLDPFVPPSIYGLGQGAPYFGLERVNFLFHPNDVHALEPLKDMKEVTCDVTKWVPVWDKNKKMKWECPGGTERSIQEARNVGRLSKDYPNITGVYFDDLLGRMERDERSTDQVAAIYRAAKSVNPRLKMWAVLYSHELERTAELKLLAPYIDVVNLWIWNSPNIKHQETYIQQCRELFPGKPIVMGCYLRDYSIPAPVPVELVLKQIEGVAKGLERGWLSGYSILASVLIDSHRPQADAIRDFIAANS